ncbi:MAG: T9SS type A sorting domain-containing protein [Ignavibacteriaceae bacterium]|nr:T9SS type A sorting domain-containing protein [Ignavibacteriaceae bacterium]
MFFSFTNYGDDFLQYFNSVILLAVLCTATSFPQFTAKVMTYNVLNYSPSSGPARNPYLKLIISTVNPDILVVQEISNLTGFNTFRDSVVNIVLPGHSAGPFIDGNDSDNAIFFKSSMFEFVSHDTIKTALRDISEYIVRSKLTLDTLIIYSLHLKASSGGANEILRGAEIDLLRNVTNKLHSGANFIVVGDYNIYKSSEVAYTKLLSTSGQGYFKDPIPDMTGIWNNVNYAQYHTQSPRDFYNNQEFGGMDDRFDMILVNQNVWDIGGIHLLPGTYTAYGNDGDHYNMAVNVMPNTAVSQEIADALVIASDHIPVYVNLSFDTPLPVELVSFTGTRAGEAVNLKWQTATEINNMGFEIERSQNASFWSKIGFVEGNNTTNSPKYYSFVEKTRAKEKLYYRLKQIDNDGTSEYSNVVEVAEVMPKNFLLSQNFPNPFNPTTTIEYSIPEQGYVTLKVYDMTGSEVANLVEGVMESGFYSINFAALNIAGGNYLYKLVWNNSVIVKKMLYLP